MTIHCFRNYIKVLSGLCLMIFVGSSCTSDYFKDENNFRLYVPQIEDGSIQNFYVAFHSESGAHAITKQFSAPFDKDDMMKEGILRFKLKPGPYKISCFADSAPGTITTGHQFDDSYKYKEEIDVEHHIYTSHNVNNTRAIFTGATVYPIGHPMTKDAVEVNIDDNQCYKGTVVLTFKDLPAGMGISQIEAHYNGLATLYNFDGSFYQFTDVDDVMSSFNTADFTSGSDVVFSNLINPSAGTAFGVVPGTRGTRAGVAPLSPAPLELNINLLNATGDVVGNIPFTQADFNAMAAADKPVDQNGNPVPSLVLNPRATIKFTFKGFSVFKIEITNWGDIVEGETTPM